MSHGSLFALKIFCERYRGWREVDYVRPLEVTFIAVPHIYDNSILTLDKASVTSTLPPISLAFLTQPPRPPVTFNLPLRYVDPAPNAN